MKKITILLLTLVAALMAATDYSGIWNGKGGFADAKYGALPATAQLTLLQAGTAVTGTLKINNGKPMPISNGTVSGSTITFTAGKGTGSLTQNGATLQGKLTAPGGQVFNVVFTH